MSCSIPKTGQRLGQIVQLSLVNSQHSRLRALPIDARYGETSPKQVLQVRVEVLQHGAAAVEGNFFGRPKDRPPGSPLIEQRVIEREPRVVEVWTQES